MITSFLKASVMHINIYPFFYQYRITICKYFILIFSLIIFSKSYSQPSSFNDQILIENYHILINDAELKICNKDYNDAIKIYKEAFKLLNNPFPKDIYNFILVCIYQNKYTNAFEFSRKLVRLGVGINFFDHIPLNYLKTDSLKWENFVLEFPKLQNDYLRTVDHELRNKIINLNRLDQEKYCSNGVILSSSFDNLETTFKEIVNLLREYGYPNEYKIGIFIENDSIISELPQDVIIRHIFQEHWGNLDEYFRILSNCVLQGNLDPYKLGQFDNFRHQPINYYGIEKILSFNNNYYIDRPCFELFNSEFINSNRRKIFLYPIEDEITKINFIKENRNLNYKFSFSFLSDSIAENNQKDYILIKEFLNNPRGFNFKGECENNYHQNNNIEKYYNFVNKAEIGISSNKLNKALYFYEKAFKNYTSPFPKDVYNALLVSINISKIKTAFKYSRILLKYGVGLNFFDQQIIRKLKDYHLDWNLMVSELPKFQEYYNSNYDKSIINELNLITNSYNYKKFRIKSDTDIIDVSLDSIYNRLFELIDNTGYPGHQIVGVFTYNDTIIMNSPYYILANFYSQYEIDHEAICKYYKQVKMGGFMPKDFIQLINYSKKIESDFWKSPIMISSENNIYILNFKNLAVKQRVDRYNEFRKKIYCFDYNDEQKKMIFRLKAGNSKYDLNYLYPAMKINYLPPYQLTDTFKKIDLNDY